MEMPRSRTIPDLLDEMTARFPDREALVGGPARLTYAALRRDVRRVAKGLHALGIRPGDKVAILMGNRPEWVIAALAAASIGAVMVGLNTWVTAPELEYQLQHSDTRLLVTVDRYLRYDYPAMLATLEPRATRLPCLERIVCLGPTRPGMLDWDALLAAGADLPDAAIDAAARAVAPPDIAFILYTSGSTARPKGVLLQHFALIENMWCIGERMHLTERDRLWLAVSLFWGFGCENALFTLLTHGGCIVLQEHFDAGDALALIARERCSVFYGTPNMVQALVEHPERDRHDLSSLRCGATLGSPDQMRRAIALVPQVSQVYGLTETYGNCSVSDAAEPPETRAATMGRPLDGVTIRICDPETGAVLPVGAIGEIRVKGYITCGYYKDPERTASSFDADGFFLTGDLGSLDADGRVAFRGRLKEMIKTGGINVAPLEVEAALLAHPAVRLAFVVGLPDEERDEVIGAVVVPQQPGGVDEATLVAHCRERLAAYKRPRRFRFVTEAELPLTVTGKVQKNRMGGLFDA